jgi:hypothetical protein
MNRVHLRAATLALLFCTTGSLMASENPAASLSMEQSVVEVVEKLDLPVVSRPLLRSRAAVLASPGGSSAFSDAIYRPLGRNIWNGSFVLTTRTSTLESTVISLCGLVELVGASGSGVRQSHTRVLRFDVGSGASEMCNPRAGSTFVFSVESEATYTYEAEKFLGGSRSVDRTAMQTVSWSCTAGQRERHTELPAFAWTDVIPVSCTGTSSSSAQPALRTPVYSRWFYLPESAFYLQLDAGSDAMSARREFEFLELGADDATSRSATP